MVRRHILPSVTALVCLALLTAAVLTAGSESLKTRDKLIQAAAAPLPGDDDTTYLDINKMLFMVSNHADFGNDPTGIFGVYYQAGVLYPYLSPDSAVPPSLMEAGGIWLTGFVDDEFRVAMSSGFWDECEFSPGPIVGGAAVIPTEEHRVYKLYSDRLESNPNTDYLEWPADLGAPVDDSGRPAMRGDQMLWTVFNDADTSRHIADGGSTDPLGVEVQLTAWASDEDGDIFIPLETRIEYEKINAISSSMIMIDVDINDFTLLDGHTYQAIVHEDGESNVLVKIYDVTAGETVQEDLPYEQGLFDAGRGFQVEVDRYLHGFESFQVTANASGALSWPEAGAVFEKGWPTGYDNLGDPLLLSDNQQVGGGHWAIARFETTSSPQQGTYEMFLVHQQTFATPLLDDYEIRFTGSNSNPEVGGSHATSYAASDPVFWVPFEIWNIGSGTPDDPSDDYRLLPVIWESNENKIFALDNYGTEGDGAGWLEHAVSDGDDDPSTDAIEFYLPYGDDTPGDGAYQAAVADLLDGTPWGAPIGDREVLGLSFVNVDGGTAPPFNQDMPEIGTVFRITTTNHIVPDTFQFVAEMPGAITSGPAGMKIHFNYKIFNKSDHVIDSFYFSHFCDGYPGNYGLDYSACDTLDDLYYDYSYISDNNSYGVFIPAVGFKINSGMLVPAPGHNAYFDTELIPDHRNLGMTNFAMIHHNGTMPYDNVMTYNYTRSLNGWDGDPYVYEDDTLLYNSSGDPVTGTGDVWYGAHHMLAGCGPVTLNPGDSQSVTLTYGVGQGNSNLNSITALRDLLNNDDDIPTDVGDDDPPSELPGKFTLHQNYPNPFNPTTYIAYDLPENAHVKLEVINILGQVVDVLVNKDEIAGVHEVLWDSEGHASGVYFYRLTAGDRIETKKMVLLK